MKEQAAIITALEDMVAVAVARALHTDLSKLREDTKLLCKIIVQEEVRRQYSYFQQKIWLKLEGMREKTNKLQRIIVLMLQTNKSLPNAKRVKRNKRHL